MKKALLYLLGLAVIALALCWYIDLSHQARPVQLDADTGNVERGAYLARASGCIACHTNVDEGGGAFHEKKDKNKKVNLGGSYRREIKKKYKKPKTRGQKKRGKK